MASMAELNRRLDEHPEDQRARLELAALVEAGAKDEGDMQYARALRWMAENNVHPLDANTYPIGTDNKGWVWLPEGYNRKNGGGYSGWVDSIGSFKPKTDPRDSEIPPGIHEQTKITQFKWAYKTRVLAEKALAKALPADEMASMSYLVKMCG